MESFACRKSNGMWIRGRKYTASEQKDAVVLCHGFTASMKETEEIAERLVKEGYTSYIFDFCGGGFETISDGDFHTYMTPLTEVEDVACVIDYVKKEEGMDRVCLLGCSQGGFVSALYASEHPENIHKLILYYPAFCIPDDARKGSMQVITFDPAHIPDVVGTMPMQVSGEYPQSVLHMDIYAEIRGYTGKVLLLHGTHDTIVPIAYADKAKAVYGENCEYHRLEQAPHGFHEEPYFSQALHYTLHFLNR